MGLRWLNKKASPNYMNSHDREDGFSLENLLLIRSDFAAIPAVSDIDRLRAKNTITACLLQQMSCPSYHSAHREARREKRRRKSNRPHHSRSIKFHVYVQFSLPGLYSFSSSTATFSTWMAKSNDGSSAASSVMRCRSASALGSFVL